MRFLWILAAAAVFAQPPQTTGDKQRASIALQMESIRKQSEAVGVRIPPGGNAPVTAIGTAPANADCDPIDEVVVTPLIDAAAKQQQVQPKLLRAIIGQESAFRPCAISAKGASGLMQLMPSTATELGVTDVFDPKQNIEAGAKYLKQLLQKYKGDLPQTLAAYNAGPSAVDQAGGIPDIAETRDYVKSVTEKMKDPPPITPPVPPKIPMPKPIGN